MNLHNRIVVVALSVSLTIILIRPVTAAGWSVLKNEQDPFDASKSTFMAMMIGGTGVFAIRCLEGTISLVVASGPSNAAAGDAVELKIVADGKGVQEESAEVLESTNVATSVQFGDASTLDYLEGAQRISLRYTLAGATSTVSYLGGKTLNDVILKTRKACGLQSGEVRPSTSRIGRGMRSAT